MAVFVVDRIPFTFFVLARRALLEPVLDPFGVVCGEATPGASFGLVDQIGHGSHKVIMRPCIHLRGRQMVGAADPARPRPPDVLAASQSVEGDGAFGSAAGPIVE